MTTIELVREMEPWKAGQEIALYRRGEAYVVVSTVNLTTNRMSQDPASTAIVELTGVVSAIAGAVPYATDGEETMAFPADADGEITDWGELACANGSGSRAEVLAQLESGEGYDLDARLGLKDEDEGEDGW